MRDMGEITPGTREITPEMGEITPETGRIMEKMRHITEEMWERFSDGSLDATEEASLYAHVAQCSYCAERFADRVGRHFSCEPPKYLHGEIIERSQRADAQAVAVVHKASKRARLFFYSLKVGFAVMVSVFLLTITTWMQGQADTFFMGSGNWGDDFSVGTESQVDRDLDAVRNQADGFSVGKQGQTGTSIARQLKVRSNNLTEKLQSVTTRILHAWFQ